MIGIFGRTIGVLWSLPTTILGLILMSFAGVESVAVSRSTTALVVVLKPDGFLGKIFNRRGIGGLTLGNIIFFGSSWYADGVLLIHEGTHVRQCMILGATFLPLYGLASLLAIVRKQDYYTGNWFEEQAYRAQAIPKLLWLWE